MKKILILVSILFSFGVLVACNSIEVEFELENKDVVYNGEIQTYEYTNELNGYDVEYLNNSHINIGEYEVTLIFSNEIDVIEETVLFTIIPYTITLEDLNISDIEFDGNNHSIVLKEIEGLEYSFELENNYYDIGNYTNTLYVNSSNENINSIEIEFSFNIVDSEFSLLLEETYFINNDVIYNSEIQSTYLNTESHFNELGYEIEYTNNKAINTGYYEVKALITNGIINFEIKDIFKINRQVINVEFIGETQYYENEEIDLYVDIRDVQYNYYNELNEEINLPTLEGVYYIEVVSLNENIELLNNKKEFEIKYNYNELLNNTHLDNTEVEFNYEHHNILLVNHDYLISKGFEVNYYYDNTKQLPIEAGLYNVFVTIEKENYYKEITSELKIRRKSISPIMTGEAVIVYGEEYSFEVFVDSRYIDVKKIFFDIDGNEIVKPTKVGVYYVMPILKPLHDSYEINYIYNQFEIVLSEYDQTLIDETTFNNKEVVYDGNFHSIRLDNHVFLILNGFEITYSNNTFKNSGIYSVQVTIEKNGYIKILNADLIITQMMLLPEVIDIFVQEGIFYNFEITNNFDIEYTINYFNSNNELIAKPSIFGHYYFIVQFNNKDEDIIIDDLKHYFTINLSNYDQSLIDNAQLIDKTVEFNNNYHTLSVSNESVLRMERYVITFSYNNDKVPPVEIGEYLVTASIYKNNTLVKELTANLFII
ncbi:MAG: MBG domain-containing protein [bacterium]